MLTIDLIIYCEIFIVAEINKYINIYKLIESEMCMDDRIDKCSINMYTFKNASSFTCWRTLISETF